MLLLNRYILKHFLRNLALLLSALVALYLLIDFFSKIDDFLDKGKPLSLVCKYFALCVPFILEQMSPVCILLAGVITLGVLNRSNELIALKACGIPLWMITRPIIAAGAVCVLVFLALSQWVMPRAAAVTNAIWNKEIKGRVAQGIVRNGRFFHRGEEGFYSFLRPDPKKDEFTDFSYAAWDERHELRRLLVAQHAVWAEGKWTLRRGQELVRDEDGRHSTRIFAEEEGKFPETPEEFFVPSYRGTELSLLDLYETAREQNSPEEADRAWADFYGRVSYILLGLPLLLLGLPLLLLVYRKWGRDLSLAVPASCGMAFLCWGLWIILLTLARAGSVPPLAAAAAVHILVGLTGVWLLIREDI